ncbi:MAG: aldehyde ferredoxin oxidoreductase family protein [Dehalococcoidia bacterium]|nr:MAG: aldehyde ferredoxin oxidoreductase family protein [Dehalococcoidia bacterium]
MLKGGYWGKILWVDLSSEETSVGTFDDSLARKYLGGVGLATRIIYERVTKNTNPLGPGNVLVFATGPYQATNIASAGRCTVSAESPLTEYWGESNGGGHIGPELKRAGFDAVVITGRAKRPVYLWINDGRVEIRDGSKFWGLETVEAVDALKEAVGDTRAAVSSIGPAGENLVKYACIVNDKHGFFGRCGLGAVMGSKNLKALVVRGTLKPPVANPDKLKDVYKDVLKKVKAAEFTKTNSEHGQPSSTVPREENGLLPMKNWAQDTWPQVSKIGTPRYTEELQIKGWACPYCVMGCHRRITNPNYKSETSGPEYETLAMIGSDLLIDDLGAIVIANDLCNRYGMDTIELGGVLAWAFECYENGLITKEDTDGVELKWGSGEALVEMTEKIAKRDGIGDLLAEGLRACVERVPASKLYSVEAMGQAVAAHDPRAYFGETITTIASTRGSCHIHGFAEAMELDVLLPELGISESIDKFDATQKGYVGAIYQDIQQFWNSLTWCFFYFFSDVSLADQVNILNAITGWDITPEEAQKIGERIVCLQQMFNLENGLVPEKENVMPERLTIPHKEGGAAGQVPPWQAILKEYWETKGWVNGIPTRGKLKELGLDGLESKRVLSFKRHDYRGE